METEMYKRECRLLKHQYDCDRIELDKDYALSHNTVKVGDVIQDHLGFIEVKEISWGVSIRTILPECIYTGIVLSRIQIPNKKYGIRVICQSNIIK